MSFISAVLCLSLFCGTYSTAYESAAVDKYSQAEYTYDVNSSIDSVNSAPDGVGAKSVVSFFFVFLRESPGLLGTIEGVLLIGTKVKILEFSDLYCLVETSNNRIGYVFKSFLKGGKDGTLSISRTYDSVYVGETNKNRITATYDGAGKVYWSSENTDIVTVDKETGLVRGVSPGITSVIAKVGTDYEVSCKVTCVNYWGLSNEETSYAEKEVTVKLAPGSQYQDRGTVAKGTKIIAKGDLADGSGWIYVKAGDFWGYIHLDDFPGIDYLLTEYHYYDEGFNIRFNGLNSKTAAENIYYYASILNDKMMDMFNLKICPYVSLKTSPGDECKKMSDKSVRADNLSKQCPQNGNHKADSCLQTKYFREPLQGNKNKTYVSWSGHIFLNMEKSNSTLGPGSIVITTYKAVDHSTYKNKSDYEVKRRHAYTLMHETIHQFEILDHYCREDWSTEEKKCSNKGCYVCYGNNVSPDCIMNEPKYPTETDDLLCEACKKIL